MSSQKKPSNTLPPVEVLRERKVIAVVGASKNTEKEAYKVPLYLKNHGYTIIPINPTANEIFGEKCYPSLDAIPPDIAKDVEVVEIFRPSEELAGFAEQLVEFVRKFNTKPVFWSQLGLESEEAKNILKSNDIDYVMNMCMMQLHKAII